MKGRQSPKRPRFTGPYPTFEIRLQGGTAMQFFYWIVLLIVIGIAVFAIQNSNAPLVTIKLHLLAI